LRKEREMKAGHVALIVAALALASAAARGAGAAESLDAGALLQRGVYEEETVGDIDAAMDIYREVAGRGDESRASAADAEYRLGVCYVKKGDKAEALATFASIASQYAGEFAVANKAAGEIAKLAAAPGAPKVVETVPAALADDVDPSLDKMSVTFNQPMMDRSWSWTGGGETFPKMTGRPQYDDAKTTCSVGVALEAGKVYWVGVNSPSHRNFKNARRVAAARYVILFATKGADGKPTPIPDNLARQAKQINKASAQTTGSEAPPSIVKTSPEAFAVGVPVETSEITVTFDQPMTDGSWSWTGGGDTYPEGAGAIHYDEKRTTCVRPVKLEPGKAYWVGVNSPSHRNFVSAKNVAAPWYIIVFTTRTADGKTIAIPDDMAARARQINAAAKASSAAPGAR
jgi:hypothetical protein